ncbi:hypothetical protein A2U01_0076814 [Trifolium medium]|uniref:Uncharacterized protein n=1 Tax=Trifolium medium TaxID=97028 RepID=A0A392T360_9FABA|nr:hypothetical protein [Trifolium medium]
MKPWPQGCSGQDQAELLQCLFGEEDPRPVGHLVEPRSRSP